VTSPRGRALYARMVLKDLETIAYPGKLLNLQHPVPATDSLITETLKWTDKVMSIQVQHLPLRNQQSLPSIEFLPMIPLRKTSALQRPLLMFMINPHLQRLLTYYYASRTQASFFPTLLLFRPKDSRLCQVMATSCLSKSSSRDASGKPHRSHGQSGGLAERGSLRITNGICKLRRPFC